MKYDEIVFLDAEDINAAHDEALRLDGGDPSVLNPGLVISATMAPRSGYYGSLAELAAVYAHGLAKNHGYQDANKRTATIAMGQFLGANGFPVELGPEWVKHMESIADGTMSRDELTVKIAELIGGDVPIED